MRSHPRRLSPMNWRREGYPVILDPNVVFPRRPGKVTVAPRRTVEERSEELKAYFRAITRTFWFMRDVNNFQYLHDLEARLRKLTHNEDEQRLFIASAPDRVDSWALPMDGGIERHALERIIQEMVKRGRLERPIPVERRIQRRRRARCLSRRQHPGRAQARVQRSHDGSGEIWFLTIRKRMKVERFLGRPVRQVISCPCRRESTATGKN